MLVHHICDWSSVAREARSYIRFLFMSYAFRFWFYHLFSTLLILLLMYLLLLLLLLLFAILISSIGVWERTSERCSSIFIGKAEYFVGIFFLLNFLVHALPCLIFSLRHQRCFGIYTQTKEEEKKTQKTTLTHRKRLDCNENQPHWTGNNNNNF